VPDTHATSPLRNLGDASLSKIAAELNEDARSIPTEASRFDEDTAGTRLAGPVGRFDEGATGTRIGGPVGYRDAVRRFDEDATGTRLAGPVGRIGETTER